MSVIIQDNGKISIEAEDSYHGKKVVEISLTENKKDIFVIEGCDYYFASKLNYKETTKLINGLKHMRSKMCNVEKALGLFKMFFEMKDKKSITNNV